MLYTNPFLFLKYENDHNIKITGLALLGGLSGRFLSGYIAWNVFYLRNNQKYSLIKSEKGHDLRQTFTEFNPSGSKNTIKFPFQTDSQEILQKLNQLI